MALLVMFNNYFHDLATAVFAVSAFAAFYFVRGFEQRHVSTLAVIADGLWKVGLVSLFFILALGGVRAAFYMDYEWSHAAGQDQLTALAIKHVVLASLTAAGLWALLRARRRVREAREANGAE